MLVLFSLVAIILTVSKVGKDAKLVAQTGVLVTSFSAALLYIGWLLVVCFILSLTYFRILEISELKVKSVELENYPVRRPESSSDSDSPTCTDLCSPCWKVQLETYPVRLCCVTVAIFISKIMHAYQVCFNFWVSSINHSNLMNNDSPSCVSSKCHRRLTNK